MRAALLLLALVAGFTSCRKTVTVTSSTVATAPDTLIAGTVINSAGTWSAHAGKETHRLEVTVSGTSVSWRAIYEEKLPGGGTTGGNTSSGTTLSAPTDPWFIYVESPRRLWIFNGSNQLDYNLSNNNNSRSGPAIYDGKLHSTQERVPEDLILRLPPDLKKLFPPVEPKTPRPSF